VWRRTHRNPSRKKCAAGFKDTRNKNPTSSPPMGMAMTVNTAGKLATSANSKGKDCSRSQLIQIAKFGNRPRAGLLAPKEGMFLLQRFRSVGMTPGYQEFSSTSSSCQLRYLGLIAAKALFADTSGSPLEGRCLQRPLQSGRFYRPKGEEITAQAFRPGNVPKGNRPESTSSPPRGRFSASVFRKDCLTRAAESA
jgi:hypothetical protein